MPMVRDAVRGPAVLSFLLLAIVFGGLLAGCRVTVEEPSKAVDSTQSAGTTSTSATALPLYDVAISAIDFDPPLGRDTLVNSDQPVKLVAAVENRGTMQLTRLTVEAKVTNQKGDFSTQDQVQLDKLSPGETKVVEFGSVGSLVTFPRSPAFRIRVAVDGPQLDPALPKPSRDLIVRVSDQ